jgi:hypothetical protein
MNVRSLDFLRVCGVRSIRLNSGSSCRSTISLIVKADTEFSVDISVVCFHDKDCQFSRQRELIFVLLLLLWKENVIIVTWFSKQLAI